MCARARIGKRVKTGNMGNIDRFNYTIDEKALLQVVRDTLQRGISGWNLKKEDRMKKELAVKPNIMQIVVDAESNIFGLCTNGYVWKLNTSSNGEGWVLYASKEQQDAFTIY